MGYQSTFSHSTWSQKTVWVFIATTEEVRSLQQPLSILSQSLGPPGQIQSHRDADFLRDSAKREPALDPDSKMEIMFCLLFYTVLFQI